MRLAWQARSGDSCRLGGTIMAKGQIKKGTTNKPKVSIADKKKKKKEKEKDKK